MSYKNYKFGPVGIADAPTSIVPFLLRLRTNAFFVWFVRIRTKLVGGFAVVTSFNSMLYKNEKFGPVGIANPPTTIVRLLLRLLTNAFFVWFVRKRTNVVGGFAVVTSLNFDV